MVDIFKGIWPCCIAPQGRAEWKSGQMPGPILDGGDMLNGPYSDGVSEWELVTPRKQKTRERITD